MTDPSPRAIRITVTIGSAPMRMLELASPVLCGSGRAADVRVTDPSVAPVQLRLARDGDGVVAIAVAPGVQVDGVALAVDQPVVVTGRAIKVGPARLVAAAWTDAPATDPARTDSLARELMRDLLGEQAVPPPELVVESGPAAGQRLALPGVGTRVVIGRGDSGWVVLDPDLSRNHAVVEHRPDGAWLYDLESKNGTRINGAPAPSEAPGAILADGAIIAMGKTTIRYRDPAAAALGGAAAMLIADTHTRTGIAIPVEVPPRWPIAVAAVVAAAAFATVILLLVSGG
ncbi:MAG: FHA domain-containing protein [Myxococcales bacterium]|nr:FHA domain-containing protein [Myxococcales bacterium]